MFLKIKLPVYVPRFSHIFHTSANYPVKEIKYLKGRQTPIKLSRKVQSSRHIALSQTYVGNFERIVSKITKRFESDIKQVTNEIQTFNSNSSDAVKDDRIIRETAKTCLSNSVMLKDGDINDNKMERLQYNVSRFKPNEVNVKIGRYEIIVHAKHEEKTMERHVFREFIQQISLPDNINPAEVKWNIKDGVLTIYIPVQRQT